jgi:hypothetical protein
MRDDLDFIGVICEALHYPVDELMKVEAKKAGVQLHIKECEHHVSYIMYHPHLAFMLTRVYIVSYAVLRASRPSSNFCVQGPICTVRMSSGLTTVSWYKLGRIVAR